MSSLRNAIYNRMDRSEESYNIQILKPQSKYNKDSYLADILKEDRVFAREVFNISNKNSNSFTYWDSSFLSNYNQSVILQKVLTEETLKRNRWVKLYKSLLLNNYSIEGIFDKQIANLKNWWKKVYQALIDAAKKFILSIMNFIKLIVNTFRSAYAKTHNEFYKKWKGLYPTAYTKNHNMVVEFKAYPKDMMERFNSFVQSNDLIISKARELIRREDSEDYYLSIDECLEFLNAGNLYHKETCNAANILFNSTNTKVQKMPQPVSDLLDENSIEIMSPSFLEKLSLLNKQNKEITEVLTTIIYILQQKLKELSKDKESMTPEQLAVFQNQSMDSKNKIHAINLALYQRIATSRDIFWHMLSYRTTVYEVISTVIVYSGQKVIDDGQYRGKNDIPDPDWDPNNKEDGFFKEFLIKEKAPVIPFLYKLWKNRKPSDTKKRQKIRDHLIDTTINHSGDNEFRK